MAPGGIICAMKSGSSAKDEGRGPRRSADTRLRILQRAGELIGEKGEAKVAVRDIAEAAGVSTALVHTLIGRAEAVVGAIVGHFLDTAEKNIEIALRYQRTPSTPISRLIALLDATLDVFGDHPSLGKAVLRELKIKPGDTTGPVARVFARVDGIVAEARDAGDLNSWAAVMAPSDIRQTLFGVMYWWLRACYLHEGQPPDADTDPSQVRTLVLRVLQAFCAGKAQNLVEQEIERAN